MNLEARAVAILPAPMKPDLHGLFRLSVCLRSTECGVVGGVLAPLRVTPFSPRVPPAVHPFVRSPRCRYQPSDMLVSGARWASWRSVPVEPGRRAGWRGVCHRRPGPGSRGRRRTVCGSGDAEHSLGDDPQVLGAFGDPDDFLFGVVFPAMLLAESRESAQLIMMWALVSISKRRHGRGSPAFGHRLVESVEYMHGEENLRPCRCEDAFFFGVHWRPPVAIRN